MSRLATEKIFYGVAGVSALAPLYFLIPGTSERLAMQTARWAPRWERSVNRFTWPAEQIAIRAEPIMNRTIHRVENRLPLERMAKFTERHLRRQFDKWWKL